MRISEYRVCTDIQLLKPEASVIIQSPFKIPPLWKAFPRPVRGRVTGSTADTVFIHLEKPHPRTGELIWTASPLVVSKGFIKVHNQSLL